MGTDYIFCKIIKGSASADIVMRDDIITVFRDFNPISSVHILIVPNKHIDSVNAVKEEDCLLLGHLIIAAHQIAEHQGVDADGYRLIINTGFNAGQEIFHLHMHPIGGRKLPFPLVFCSASFTVVDDHNTKHFNQLGDQHIGRFHLVGDLCPTALVYR